MTTRIAAVAVAVAALMCGPAMAAPQTIGDATSFEDTNVVQQVRHGGGRSGGVSRGSGRAFSHSGGARFSGHRGRGRGFVGSGYYGYSDDGCWYSRRYGRWVCPYGYY